MQQVETANFHAGAGTALSASTQGPREAPSIAQNAGDRARRQERKAALLSEAARNFCEIPRPDLADISAFKELFYQLIEVCSKSDKRNLSACLARNHYTPRTILMYFAISDHSVAAPVLLFAPGINEADIVHLSKRLSQEHLKILCRRMDLTPTAISALKSAGGWECSEILASNRTLNDAPGDQDAAPASVATNVKPIDDYDFPTPLSAPRENETSGSNEPSASDELLALVRKGGRLGREVNSETPKRFHDHTKPIEKQLLQAARADGKSAISALVEDYCGFEKSKVHSMLNDGPEGSCVLLKGLGLDIVTALQLLLLVDRQTGSSRASYDATKALYQRLDFAQCRAFLEKLGGQFVELSKPQRNRDQQSGWRDAVASRQAEIGTLARRLDQKNSKAGAIRKTG